MKAMMTPYDERVERLFHAAIELEGEEMEAFLATACAGDRSLYAEVKRLRSFHDRAPGFLETGAVNVAARQAARQEPPHQAEVENGQLLNKFKVLTLLGRGGMGEVYRALDTQLGREVALKVLPSSFARDEVLLRRFQQEARAASALNHPNILTIHDFGEANSMHFIATELIDGVTLRERMEQAPLDLTEVLQIIVQAANALAAAHEAKIIHRDIKPANIMLRRDRVVKILDFGLAKFTEKLIQQETTSSFSTNQRSLVHTELGTVMCTFKYASPEQLQAEAVDERTDVWSLGVVLYEMIARQAPFNGSSLEEIKMAVLTRQPLPLDRFSPDAPDELQRILTKALQKDREKRYQTIKDLLLDLEVLKQRVELEGRIGLARGDQGLFIGPKYPYYLVNWRMSARAASPVFNWVALLLPLPWIAYRKMYLFLSIITTSGILIGTLMELSGADSSYVGAIMAVAAAVFGNTMYRWHVVRKLRAIKGRGLERQQEVAAIRRTGGTSKAAGAVCLVVVLAAILFNFIYLRHWDAAKGQERQARAIASEGARIRARAVNIGLQAESTEAKLMTFQNPVKEQEQIKQLAREQVKALTQSATLMRESAAKFEQAKELFTDEKLKELADADRQLSLKYLELLNIGRKRAEILLTLGSTPVDTIIERRNIEDARILQANRELLELAGKLQKLNQGDSIDAEGVPSSSSLGGVAPLTPPTSPDNLKARELYREADQLILTGNEYIAQSGQLGQQLAELNERRDREQIKQLLRQIADLYAQSVATANQAVGLYEEIGKLSINDKLKQHASLLASAKRKWAEATDLRREEMELYLTTDNFYAPELIAKRNRFRQSYDRLQREAQALDAQAKKMARENPVEVGNELR